jgi:hypothetical protein
MLSVLANTAMKFLLAQNAGTFLTEDLFRSQEGISSMKLKDTK